MQRKQEIENKMKHWMNEYNKKDSLCKAFLKKKTSRGKKRDCDQSSENFEIVIENAETAEVKSFNGNNSNTFNTSNINHSETDLISKSMSLGNTSNDENVGIQKYEAETAKGRGANIFDFNEDDLNMENIYSHCQSSSIEEVENYFDKNGNEIVIKTEPVEYNEQNHEQNHDLNDRLCDVREHSNDSNQSNLNDTGQSESGLWYIATGYDFDMMKDINKINKNSEVVQSSQTDDKGNTLTNEERFFDISNIQIKEESIRSIVEEDGLFDKSSFVNTNENHVENYNQVNKDLAIQKSDKESGEVTKVTEDDCKVNESEGDTSVSCIGHCTSETLDIAQTFPNLTSAIKNIEAGSSSGTERPISSTSISNNKSSESDVIQYNQSERGEPEKTNSEETDKSGLGNKQFCGWKKLQENAVEVENTMQSPTKVKFTLKKKHAVKSQYNALGNIDSPISKDIVNKSKNPSIAGGKGDNEKSLLPCRQEPIVYKGVNRKKKMCEATKEFDLSVVDKPPLLPSCSEKDVTRNNIGEPDSCGIIDRVYSIVEEEDNIVQFELHKPEENDVDYNYVMLDGIMSLTLTEKDEIDRSSAHVNTSAHKTDTNSPLSDLCTRNMSATSQLGADADDTSKSDSKLQSDLVESEKTQRHGTTENELNINQKNASGDHLNIESLSRISLMDEVFTTEDYVIKVEDSETAEDDVDKDKDVIQDNLGNTINTRIEDTCDTLDQGGELSAVISKHESISEHKKVIADNLDVNSVNDDDSTVGMGLKIPLILPEPLEIDTTYESNKNSNLETIETQENDKFCDSDNNTGVSVDSDDDDDDDEDDNSSACESYRIIHRYIFDRCTGNTIQKILVRVKERKTYTDHELDDDEIEGKRSYKVEDKLKSDKYSKDYVKKLAGEEFNLRYLQENGLQYPILFGEKTGLGLRVPSDNFKVCDVKACVGSRRMLDVMDVNTQKGLEMTMKEWTKYYETTDRDRLLNVISLEFSHTKLENYVESPNLVREIDWVDSAWPQHLKDCQTESTNAIDKMKYPKVQKYCLMSVAGCYTDFHIDFGGTSVWYHILHGEKIFWLIPPTDKNLAKYENWVLSGKQGDAFLADSIEECQMIQLVAGNTFIIPSGWIHAVYTPKDSLVFGGNFLHSFNMVNQLKVSAIEDKTHVPMKFRYPFYAEINWYVLERYVHSLTGVTYLEKPQLNEDLEVINPKIERDQANFELLEEKLNKRLSVSLTRIDDTSPGRKSTSDDDSTASGPTRSPGQASTLPRTGRKSSSESANSLDLKSIDKPEIMKVPYKSPVKKKTKYVHLTKYELEGLIEVLGWVESLPPSKKGVPKDLIDPDAVLREVKRLIQEHMKDNPELAITGEPVLEWTKATKKLIKLKQKAKTAKLLGTHCAPKVKTAGGKNASGNRHRRVRCKKCEPCTRDDCMECNFCKDMRKYGGPGRAKQSCISRQCLAPILPKGIVCLICKMPICMLDKPVKTDGAVDDDAEDYSSSLMECGLCWEIVHPLCLRKKNENLNNDGMLNEDLPNSWKCSKCCFDGKEGKLMARVFKGGWRPTPASSPPPLSVSPPLQPHSPTGIQEVIVTEGKRVTLNQGIDTKKTMPKLSLSPEHRELYSKPFNGSGSGEPDYTDLPKVKMEVSGDESVQVKMEVNETSSIINTPTTGIPKTYTKRSASHLDENPSKKKRNVSPSPSRPSSKSSKSHDKPKPSPSSGRKSGKILTPDITGKRSKRETIPRSGTRCTYDFDDEEECMDISTPLPDKGKGKGIKGRKNLHLKSKDFGASLGSNMNSKSRTQTLEPKTEDRGHLTKYSSEKLCSEQLRQTLITHIERRNLPVIKPQFVVRPAPISPPDDFCVMTNGQRHPLSRKVWTFIFHYLPSADLARCQAVCQIWNRWCINPDLWKKIDLSKKRIVQTHLMGIVRRQPEYLDLSSVIMTQKQILWLLERIPLLKTLIVSKCSWATISGLCMSACPLLYKLDVSWATGLNDKCFEDLISPPEDRKPALKNISRLHRLRSIHLSGTEITDTALELMTLHLSLLEELNISYCTRITDRGIQILASSKSPTQDSLKVLNISGCRGLTEISLDAIKNFSKLKELYATNCIRIPSERCKSLRHPRLKIFRY